MCRVCNSPDTDHTPNCRIRQDKEWYEQTRAVVEARLIEMGFSQNNKDTWHRNRWTHKDACFSVGITPEVLGNWTYTTNHSIMKINVQNSVRNFTKKIDRKTNKVDDVLGKIEAKLHECIARNKADDENYKRRQSVERFQKTYTQTHFPETGRVVLGHIWGDTEDTIRFDIRLSAITPDMLRAIIAIANQTQHGQ